MNTTTEATMANTATTAATGWAAQSAGEKVFTLLVFGLSTAATAAFAYYLLTDPSKLTELWTTIRALPILVQAIVWLLCLPWMIALWMWSMPWALVIRFLLVIAMLIFTEYLMYPFK